MTFSHDDYMNAALVLAERGVGLTSPNPSVGCVIVKDNRIIARARTAIGGRPHAETQALQEAGEFANGADVYVSLEPCAHFGHTPPCVNALIAAKVKRVFVAQLDPDPRVAGKGVSLLNQAGIETNIGICKNEAQRINSSHFTRFLKNRPFIQLKLALSKDGFIAPLTLIKTQISGELSQKFVHILRSKADAIMVGSGTFKADNPRLDVRLNGLEDRSPKRFIIGKSKAEGFQTLETLDFEPLLKQNICRILIEGGAHVAQSLFELKLIDELILIRSKTLSLYQGLHPFAVTPLNRVLEQFSLNEQFELGTDIIEIYEA